MPMKWLAFFIFLWLFGMFFGAMNEQKYIDTYVPSSTSMVAGTTNMTAQNTMNYLFTINNVVKETSILGIPIITPNSDYFKTLFTVVTLNLNCVKDYNETTGVYTENFISYLFRTVGILGILCLVILFIEILQGGVSLT